MCGISGVLGTRNRALIEGITAALRHRGPDGVGHCSHETAHIGATRLSIIDLGAGAQPIYNETGSLSLVFNGEIYNHRQLRSELECKGHVFSTRTDSEVVIHAYEEFGRDCVRYLRGMFAFAILDGNRLFLARDRLGIKPLYYASLSGGRQFVFASEIKAIIQHPDITPRLSLQAFADSLLLGHPVGDHTFFEGVKSLPAGHSMTVSWREERWVGDPQPYFVRESFRNENMRLNEAMDLLEGVLVDAVETHMAADVEVGLTLSGGIDSAVMVLLAHDLLGKTLQTFTVADHDDHPDVLQASHLATMIGARHQKVIMSFEQYLAAIPGLIVTEEQPSSLSGLPYYFLCSRIASCVKACLHGEGADELFGGYREYLQRDRRILYYRQRLPILKRLGILPSEEASQTVRRLSSAVSFEEYLEQIFAVNLGDALQRQHLDIVDKYSMAVGLEMRVPYLHDPVVDLTNRIPLRLLVSADLGIRKYILRRLALRRFGPAIIDIVLREKLGAPSAGIRFLNRFDAMCNEYLPEHYVSKHEFGFCFDNKRQLLLFELFLEVFVVHRGDGGAVPDIRDFMRERAQGRSDVIAAVLEK
jgi:asparagine synthase (glutamine-hydrolysing)